MHEVACLRFKGSSSEEYLYLTHHHGKISLYSLPYSPRTYSSSVYRVYLPFYRVKNPISPSLPMVLGLSHHTPTPTIAWPLPRRYHCSMNIGAGDPTRPIPQSLGVLVDNYIHFILHLYILCYLSLYSSNIFFGFFLFFLYFTCFLTRGFVRPQ